MGIRFSCHGCAKPLNIKNELAGRRGVCPECNVRFRIPLSDAEFSTPLEDVPPAVTRQVPESREVASQRARGSTPQDPAPQSAGQRQEAVAATPVASGGVSVAGVQTEEAVTVAAASTPAARPKSELQPNPVPEAGQPAAVADLDLLKSDPSATWYVRPPSGGQYGPANADALQSWIAEGRVAKTALLWRDGWPQWREASEALPEIAHTLPGSVPKVSDDPFSDGLSSPKATTPLSLEKTSPIVPVSNDLSGNAKIGAVRRKRTSKRIALVGILAALVIGLVVTLVLVASTGGK